MDWVVIQKNEPFTNSMVIAEGTGLKNASIVRTIRAKAKRLEKYGHLRFSDLKSENLKGGRPQKICYLNEMQATLLITYLDNNEVVDDFKEELVKQFYEMKKLLLERKTVVWNDCRKLSKSIRKTETDMLAQLIEYAKNQGSKNSKFIYSNYSSLANKVAGIPNGQRDYASSQALTTLTLVEKMIWVVIQKGIEAGKHYKQIYQDTKQRLQMFEEITFKNIPCLGC